MSGVRFSTNPQDNRLCRWPRYCRCGPVRVAPVSVVLEEPGPDERGRAAVQLGGDVTRRTQDAEDDGATSSIRRPCDRRILRNMTERAPEDGAASASGDDSTLRAVASQLDLAAADAQGVWDVESAVRRLINERSVDDPHCGSPECLLLTAALDAVEYRLSFEDGRCELVPHLKFADGTTQPPAVDTRPSEVVDRWRALREAVHHGVWRSRLSHLLAASPHVVGRDRVQWAADAVGDYLETPNELSLGMERVGALRAALALTKQFGLRQPRVDVLDAMIATVQEALTDRPDAAGITLGLTHVLVGERDAPVELDALLDRARTVYAGDIHRLDDVFEQQLARPAVEARRAQLWAERVRAWLDAAAACDDVRRAHLLQTAVELASRSGNRELRQKATARLQELTLDDLGLVGISTEMIVRGEDIARAVQPVTAAHDWTEALDAFALLGPPTGEVTQNRRTVEEHAREFVLSKLFPVTQFGSDGLPRFTAASDKERAEYDLAQQETFQLQFQRRLVAEALLRFPAHHPLPTLQELAAHFSRNHLIDQPLAQAIARAFLRWWAGDYEGAGFTIAPRIETLARNLLLATNAPLYRLQRDRAPGQYPGLGYLLEQLRSLGYAESWYRYLYTLLANPAGPNLRNEMTHGFADNLDLVTAALLLHCAANLALASPGATAPEEAERPDSGGKGAAEAAPTTDESPTGNVQQVGEAPHEAEPGASEDRH